MARAKLSAYNVERAHRSGEPLHPSDGDGLYLRKQTRELAALGIRRVRPEVPIGNDPSIPGSMADRQRDLSA